MLSIIGYWLWKRKARKALKEGKTAICGYCEQPIFPGQWIAIAYDENNRHIIIHAGYHYSLAERHAFCETGFVACGIWNGESIDSKPLAVEEA